VAGDRAPDYFHTNECAQDMISITKLEALLNQDKTREKESIWTFKPFAFYLVCLNKREDVLLNNRPNLIFTKFTEI
jgi:hypothetical protein